MVKVKVWGLRGIKKVGGILPNTSPHYELRNYMSYFFCATASFFLPAVFTRKATGAAM